MNILRQKRLSLCPTKVPYAGGVFLLVAALSFLVFCKPTIAGLVVGPLVVLVLGFRYPAATLYVYAASTFLAWVPLNGSLTMSVPTLTGALFLLVAGVGQLRGERIEPDAPAGVSHVARYVFLFGAVACLSGIGNAGQLVANPRGLVTYALLALTTITTLATLRSENALCTLTQVLSWCALVTAIVTIVEFVTGVYNPLGVFHSTIPPERAYGLSDPNYNSAILDTTLPFIVFNMLTGRRLFTRAFYIVSLTASLFAICMTASRGGFLGAILSLVLSVSLISVSSGPATPISLLQRAGIVVFLGGILALSLSLASGTFWDRMSTIEDPNKMSHESRLELWADYIDDVRTRPLLGFGPGYIDPDAETERENIQHSTPLEVLTELGAMGLLSFLALSICSMVELWRARSWCTDKGHLRMAAFSGALIAAFLTFCFTGLFLNRGHDKLLWVLFGVSGAAAKWARSRYAAQPVHKDSILATPAVA